MRFSQPFSAAAATGLPSMTANGQIAMTIHQVNGDGAGYALFSSLSGYFLILVRIDRTPAPCLRMPQARTLSR
jgi:hypothetical protein